MKLSHTWSFPLPRTHTGMLLGNATLGAMIWGEGPDLRITLGRADLWDHRGGMPWKEGMSYARIRELLEAGDEKGLRGLFERTDPPAGQPHRPSVLPLGRVDLRFPADAELLDGELDMAAGVVTLRLRRGGAEHELSLCMDMQVSTLALRLPPGCLPETVTPVTSWDFVGDHLASISFAPPAIHGDAAAGGWTQTLPVDPAVAVAWTRCGDDLMIGVARGADAPSARAAAEHLAADRDYGCVAARARDAWAAYWRQVPALTLPNPRLQFLYEYGMYKFKGLTSPDGTAATLQGPWIEEYQMPPWSSDYHFNINVQMCYWPAYHGNCLDHLNPLWDLIDTWTETLQFNARVFCDQPTGLMLPHAVDDRCVCMGGFWTGSIDHGCTAWVAQMLYRHYRYQPDITFLRQRAWPFMVGAMTVFEAMLERHGDRFRLPVSVSPEYRGAALNAWGADASFQLACIHRLIEDLLEAAAILGETPRPIWRQIQDGLPRACLIETQPGQPIIGLWDGTPLEESHRHHSHLAALVPFDTIDAADPDWNLTVRRSLDQWVVKGPGLWSGWCMPWAAMLHSHQGNGRAAELTLEIWERVFTNQGHGTLHDVDFPGYSLMGNQYSRAGNFGARKNEIMQIEAGMAAVAAIQDMLLHTRRGVTHLFPGVPSLWRDCSFDGMLTEGGFRLSARRQRGRTREVRLQAPYGGTLRLANPWPGRPVQLRTATGVTPLDGDILSLTLPASDAHAVLIPAEA